MTKGFLIIFIKLKEYLYTLMPTIILEKNSFYLLFFLL